MACCRMWLVVVQMGAIVGAGAVFGYIDHQRRPVMVNTPEIPALPVKPITTPAPDNSVAPVAPVSPVAPTETPATTATPGNTPASASQTPSSETPVESTAVAPAGEQIDPELAKQGHITIAQAFELFNSTPPAFFIDARRKDVYEAGHVRDAFRLPLEAFKGREPAHLQVMPREEIYIVYCEGGNCDESVAVQKQLLLSGYQKVYVMHAGYPAWQAAGHPTQTGPDPIEP